MLRAYAYDDGNDLDEISSQLAEVFANFLCTWGISSARLVNDKSPRTPDLRDDDLPDWNLGLSFEAERLSPTEFDQLILFLSRTAAETQREFVIGGYGPSSQFAEDWGFIGTHDESPKLSFFEISSLELKDESDRPLWVGSGRPGTAAIGQKRTIWRERNDDFLGLATR